MLVPVIADIYHIMKAAVVGALVREPVTVEFGLINAPTVVKSFRLLPD